MKIALFGAGGNIGSRIAKEALSRGHEVTAVVRDPSRYERTDSRVTVLKGNVKNPADVALAAQGRDAVVSAVGPTAHDPDPQMLVEAAGALLEGLDRAGVKRLLVVGGAGSLEVVPGVRLMDAPDFPADWQPLAQAAADALKIYRANAGLDWTFLSPAMFISPGQRSGKYRTGTEQPVTDASGTSAISMEDYAVALVDELEHPAHLRQRFTVGY